MIETEISKEHMDSLKALADTNMKIGVARQTLQKLEETETSYLEERENKAVLRIQKMFDDSKELITGIRENYAQAKELLTSASSFSDFLVKSYEALTALIERFNEKSVVWEAKVKVQEEEFSQIRQQIKNDQVRIKNDSESLERAKAKMVLERRKLDDERGTLDRAITRLKEGRI